MAGGLLTQLFKNIDEEANAIRNVGKRIAEQKKNPDTGVVPDYRQIMAEETPGLWGRLSDLNNAKFAARAAESEGNTKKAEQALQEGLKRPKQKQRQQMAKEQDWLVDQNLYHWTTTTTGQRPFGEFEISKDGKTGPGVYLKRDPSSGSHYAEYRGDGGEPFLYNVVARGPIAGKEDLFAASAEVSKSGVNPASPEHWVKVQDILKKKGFTGHEYMDEVLIYEPKNLRDPAEADFNPARAESSSLTAGVAGATTVGALAAGMTPEDAAASVPVSRIIQLGMMDAKYADDATQVKRARTRYAKAMNESRAFADREAQAAANDYRTVFQQEALPERTIITPEQMVGQPLVGVRGDRSDIGLLSMVGGIPVDDVAVQGGRKFSKKYANEGYGWASEGAVASSAQNRLRRAAEQTGEQPIAVYNAMGEQSVDFSTPIAESMMRQVMNSSKLAKKDKAGFDKELRLTWPEWVGLDDPRAMEQLMTSGGKKRTAFTSIMGKKGYQMRGFPSKQETVKAVEDPLLSGAKLGDSGISMYLPDTGKDVFAIPGVHKSYDTAMPGTYLGGLEQSVPFEVMFPKSSQMLAREMTNPQPSKVTGIPAAPKPFTREQQIDAFNKRGAVYENTDQEWLDNIMTWLEKAKNEPAKTVGGLVGLGGSGSVMADMPQQPPEEPMTAGQFLTQAGGFRNASEMLNRYQQKQQPQTSYGEARATPDSMWTWIADKAEQANKGLQVPMAEGIEDFSNAMAAGQSPGFGTTLRAGLELVPLAAPLGMAVTNPGTLAAGGAALDMGLLSGIVANLLRNEEEAR
jgi:hypothetical protein